jgi:biotin carboxylase
VRPLIICRGPIRKEAIDVFREMGLTHIGILLSEKDSIVYQNALAPELRVMPDPERIHRVPDYTGANKEEREQRIRQIIAIAGENGYNAVFAGYGFMAEDETMVAALEAAGLNFIGPCARTVHDAGLKDEAKRTALKTGVSVTPGIDNATALTLLKRTPDHAALAQLIAEQELALAPEQLDADLETAADQVLAAAYAKGVDLYTVDELSETVREAVARMNEQYPNNRVRLKAISGGGGKGQRILGIGQADRAPEMVREILNEVKTTGVGDNKNVLVELNIETTRHQEIQVIGNGEWCITLG